MRIKFRLFLEPLANKYQISIIASLLVGFVALLVVPSGSFVINKLGKTLFFALISGICYLLIELLSSFFAKTFSKTFSKDYDIVEDFYNVIKEESSEHIASKTSVGKASLAVKEKTSAACLGIKDVMIGTIRSPGQLEFNLKNNCYYTPARFVKKENLPVKCITLYEDDADGTPCIKRRAMVSNAKIVKRKAIPVPLSRNNGDELYYYFTLENWKLMENSIAVKDTYKGKPLFTNMFLLDNCKYSYQLFCVDSFDEYKLIQKIEEALSGELETGNTYQINNKCSFKFAENKFFVLNNFGDIIFILSAFDYSKKPRLMFDKIKKYIDK